VKGALCRDLGSCAAGADLQCCGGGAVACLGRLCCQGVDMCSSGVYIWDVVGWTVVDWSTNARHADVKRECVGRQSSGQWQSACSMRAADERSSGMRGMTAARSTRFSVVMFGTYIIAASCLGQSA
jgi:hypothetical protein